MKLDISIDPFIEKRHTQTLLWSYSELIPYIFANNYINHVRYLPIYLRDMLYRQQHPEIARDFRFIAHKLGGELSAPAIDKVYEQWSKATEEDLGWQDQTALRMWMMVGSEVGCLLAVYENETCAEEGTTAWWHHAHEVQTAQKSFFKKAETHTKMLRRWANCSKKSDMTPYLTQVTTVE